MIKVFLVVFIKCFYSVINIFFHFSVTGLTLEIFQYLHEQYIISVEGFIAWEISEKEPEGKGIYESVFYF